MPEMHTLVLNGQNYTITDPGAARVNNTAVGDGVWSAKTIVDRLCPAFSAENRLVRCNPVEGYPLEVVTHIPENQPVTELTLRCTGKNLWDFKSGLSQCRGISAASGADVIRYGFIVTLPPGEYTISGEVLSGVNYLYFNPINLDTLVMGALTYFITSAGATTTKVNLQEGFGLYFYNANSSANAEVSEKAFYENVNIQIQAGSVATAYEPFGEEKTVAFSAPFTGDYHWENIFARQGENTYFCNQGTTTVAGRLDLPALLTKGGLANV